MLVAFGANYRTLRATVSVITNIFYTISANIAVVAPAFISNTALAITAVGTKVTGAVCALLCTALTNIRTIRASFTANADIIGTVNAGFTAIAEITFTAYTICANVTATAYTFFLTVSAFFITFGADCCTIRATLTAYTGGYTFSTGVAVRAPTTVAGTTNAVTAICTYSTRAVCALLGTAGADFRTVFTAVSTFAYHCTSPAGVTV